VIIGEHNVDLAIVGRGAWHESTYSERDDPGSEGGGAPAIVSERLTTTQSTSETTTLSIYRKIEHGILD